MKYQWVYSSGKPGPVRTVSFTGAGQQTVSGGIVKTKAAGGGWAEVKLISPVAQTSNKASYKLLCDKSGTSQVSASASVQVPAGTGTCPATPPNLTATGSITSAKAGTVTYYWAQSDGQNSAPATLTFTGPGTMAAAPLAITPPADPGSGDAVLVVTSPVADGLQPRGVHAVVQGAQARADAGRDGRGQPGEPDAHVLLRRRADVHLQRDDQRQQGRFRQLLLEAAERERPDADAELHQGGQRGGHQGL